MKVPKRGSVVWSLIEQVATGSVVGVSVAVLVGWLVGVPEGLPDALTPQMVSAKTNAPLVAPIIVCFRNSNLGFSLLKISPIPRTPPILTKPADKPRLEP